MDNQIAVALEELARVNDEAVRTFSAVLLSANVVLREIAAQIPTESESVEYLNMEECAAFLKIPLQHLYKLTSKHRIPYHKTGRTIRFDKRELVGWMQQHRVKTDAELTSA